MIPVLNAAKINCDSILPSRKHSDDAGLDLYASETKIIEGNGINVIGTGIAVDIPKGYVGLIFLKSGSNFLLGGGVVDAGYQGEIKIKIFNIKTETIQIEKGQAIAQLLIVPIETPEVREVQISDLFKDKSDRGAEGGIHLPI